MNPLIIMALVAPITITPEALEGFQLISQPKPVVALTSLEIREPTPKATQFWRIVGYLTMATCGGLVPSSVEYWKSRGGDPLITNTPANYATWFGSSIGMNSLSDWQRRSERSDLVAGFIRIGTLATCGYTSGINFRKGWKRQ